jgi:hypothetical protein
MPDQATLQEDNTLKLPEGKEGPLARPNTPLSVVDLGAGAFAVTELSPQIPSLASQFRQTLDDAGVSPENLLDELQDVKQEMAEERARRS